MATTELEGEKASYAHWRKCDFQVHTPRDPNWMGNCPFGIDDIDPATGAKATIEAVDAARVIWAEGFIDACIARKLGVVAITDHHDLVMVRYVQRAVATRKVSDPNFDLWIFPGMELTTLGGRQCLIIFDADLSDEWQQQAQGKLGIVFAHVEEKAQRASKVAQMSLAYPDVAKALDEFEALRGRYIVLPNVSEGGKHTVLSNGQHADFRRMPYFGGYLDCQQTIDTLGPKNRKRISGTDQTWSTREIYPLPTSDCRTSDYTTLGKNNTWIKLATPTAEAIRQAFLGHRSRIQLLEPTLPSPSIVNLTVDGSTILKDGKAIFSPELNSIIGGRGSGKSSLLEYVAYSMGRSCQDVPRPEYSGNERMRSLIADTLVVANARITVTVRQDNADFVVTRSPKTAQQPEIRYPNGATSTISTKELRALFPAVVYSQGELAEIGKKASAGAELTDLLQFVSPSYKAENDRLVADINTRKQAVRVALQNLIGHWEKAASLQKQKTTSLAVKERVEALEKTLPTMAPEDQATVGNYARSDAFESKRLLAARHADSILDALAEAVGDLSTARDLSSEHPDAASVQDLYASFVKDFKDGVAALKLQANTARDKLTAAEETWVTKLHAQKDARDAVLEKLGAHKVVTDQIIALREQLTEHTNQLAQLQAEVDAAGDPSEALKTAMDALKASNAARVVRTTEWTTEIERLSSGKIKAKLEADGDISELQDAIEQLAAKTGSQQSTRSQGWDLSTTIDAAADVMEHLRVDCLALLYWRLAGTHLGHEIPACDKLWRHLGTTANIQSAVQKLLDLPRVEAIATAIAKPRIALFYRDNGREVSFDKASEGQRAAALLFMLLEQPGGPLIIDQPESDLDNKIIAELTDKLHSAKARRQLFFASHNANIVVNGSSELVACLDLAADGERHIAVSGAIDSPEICSVITATMEGGEKAFRDRFDKYGY